MALSEELKILYSSSGNNVILDTLSFNHTTFENEIFFVNDFQDFTANLENSGPSIVFKKYAFRISKPSKSESGNIVLNITLDTVNLTLLSKIQTAVSDINNNPIEVTYRTYISNDTSGPQNDPPLKLFLRKIKVTNTQISGKAELVSLQNRKFPNVIYDNAFQGLLLDS